MIQFIIALETKTFKYLKEKNIRVFNGLEMFIYQGQKAFYLWTKINPEIDQEINRTFIVKIKIMMRLVLQVL